LDTGTCRLSGADRDVPKRGQQELSTDQSFLDGSEDRLVGLKIHVDVFQLPDLGSVLVDEILAAPGGDVLMSDHCLSFLENTSPRDGTCRWRETCRSERRVFAAPA